MTKPNKKEQKIAVIGGGAAGLACAVMLKREGRDVTVLERGDRLGRKLSATGNGQGNVTNVHMDASHYFSDDRDKVGRMLARFSAEDTVEFLQSMGGIFLPDTRGRVYPAGRQASAVTDLFRRELSRLGAEVILHARVSRLTYDDRFHLTFDGGSMSADAVVLACGGRAAENFGTDGSAYALAQSFGHSLTPLSPALVQLKTEPACVRGLHGIRMDAGLSVLRGGKSIFEGRGDVLFTEGGVSGDAVFRASSYATAGDVLEIDFLPDVPADTLAACLRGAGEDALLCIVPNGLGRFLARLAAGDNARLVTLLKQFRIPVTGNYGFSRAQVTRGGIPLAETDEHLQSHFQSGLFLAGEMLNVDGECGGYNLQWAFTSAYIAAEGVRKC